MVPGKRYLLPVAASALVGAVGALVEHSAAEAVVVNHTLYVQPGTGEGRLTCGWHESACVEGPPAGGHALDWSATGVFWRSYGICTALPCGPTIATGTAVTQTGTVSAPNSG